MTDPTLTPESAPVIQFSDPAQMHQLLQFSGAQNLVMGQKERKITRHKFTPEEDELLRNLVAQYKSDWCTISQHFQNRSPRQCRDRWKHYVCPEVVTGNWTEADDQLLMQKVQELGSRWSTIAQLFPGRTDIGVKNHYISITNRKKKDSRDKGHQRAVLLPITGGQDLKIEEQVPVADPNDGTQMQIELPPPHLPACDDQGGQLPPCQVEVPAYPEADPEPVPQDQQP